MPAGPSRQPPTSHLVNFLSPRAQTVFDACRYRVSAAKPVLEVNPHHSLIKALASLGDDDRSFKQDVAHLLFDEARILDRAAITSPFEHTTQLAHGFYLIVDFEILQCMLANDVINALIIEAQAVENVAANIDTRSRLKIGVHPTIGCNAAAAQWSRRKFALF